MKNIITSKIIKSILEEINFKKRDNVTFIMQSEKIFSKPTGLLYTECFKNDSITVLKSIGKDKKKIFWIIFTKNGLIGEIMSILPKSYDKDTVAKLLEEMFDMAEEIKK